MSIKLINKCEEFIRLNGWKWRETDNEYWYFDKNGCVSICINHDSEEITFLNDSGDILTLPANYYSLIGFLFHYRQIACNYKIPENMY